MSGALAGLPVVFRPVLTRVVLLTLAAAVLVALCSLAVLVPHDGAQPWGFGQRAGVVVSAVLVAGLLVLLSRPKVVADRDGLTVVNLTRRRRLAWAEVLRVNLGHGDAWVRLDLADGTTLPAMGIQPGIARRQALRDARRLRDLVDVLGTAHVPERPGR
ncbi:PH domain-containing protein [Actinacidiphila yeochonensis]|uniref:PH domain-containing protein n=1 Tax=Actinacidiphila yeochonensis TaxID=89050 RepID=UPI000559D190|nr:PH domain-containing protein [Actinacidiphila yeochonensis]